MPEGVYSLLLKAACTGHTQRFLVICMKSYVHIHTYHVTCMNAGCHMYECGLYERARAITFLEIFNQQELDEKIQREINAKKEAAEKMKAAMRKSLDKQIHDKKTREERLKAENEKQARFEAERAVQLMRQAEQKDTERAEMMKQYRLELEDQVRADMRLRPGEKKRMTDLERALHHENM